MPYRFERSRLQRRRSRSKWSKTEERAAAQKGAGVMIIAASKFQLTDIVIMDIVLIGIIGYGIDMPMRMAERILVPWKGRF